MFTIHDYDGFEFHVHSFDLQDFHQIGFDFGYLFRKLSRI